MIFYKHHPELDIMAHQKEQGIMNSKVALNIYQTIFGDKYKYEMVEELQAIINDLMQESE